MPFKSKPCFIFILALSAPAQAQLSTQSSHPTRRWELGAWAGGGPSAVTSAFGGVANRQLWIGTLYVTRPLIRWGRFTSSYFGEVMPVVITTRVPRVQGVWFYNAGHTDSLYAVVPAGDGTVFGAGIAPLGLRFSVQLGAGLLAYTEAGGGGVAFSRAVPVPKARAMNFLASAGAGVRFGKRTHRSYVLGYRFTHLSNAYTARSNPGFNAHVFYLGIGIR